MNPNHQTSQEVERELDEYLTFVNFSIDLRELIVEKGFSEVFFVNAKTNEIRKLLIFIREQ